MSSTIPNLQSNRLHQDMTSPDTITERKVLIQLLVLLAKVRMINKLTRNIGTNTTRTIQDLHNISRRRPKHNRHKMPHSKLQLLIVQTKMALR